jgi:hypothetical protein
MYILVAGSDPGINSLCRDGPRIRTMGIQKGQKNFLYNILKYKFMFHT